MGGFLWGWTGCQLPSDNFVCFLAYIEYNSGPYFGGVFAGLPLVPDIADLTPGSNFLNTLNGYSENFTRAAIVGNTPQRWNESRVAWDVLAPYIFPPFSCDPNFYPESGCGEEAVAEGVGITYDVVEALLVFTIIEQIYDPQNDYSPQIEYYGGILGGMDGIDGIWNLVVSGYSGSDGIVQSSSQNYPSIAAVQYPINGADSHLESTHSPYDHATLYQVLTGPQFSAPTQASCTFSAAPSSYTISPSGGTLTFGLNTGAGCQWSAVSGVPWLTITSGTSGTSAGNISLSVAANPVTIPRTGTIQAGNGSATANFSLTQAGVCAYSLSASSIIIQPGGGSYAVSVSTANGCVWSAVSNSTWLTITAGASGTGPGSFTLLAAPNSNDTDLVGTITVMNQTLTVTQGDPAGAPGTGWVRVNGSPQSVTFNPCQNNHYPAPTYCPQTIYEGGYVSLTVAGQTFASNYSGSTSGEQIASALASQMNYSGSPISATASGTTITITSTIRGSVTNYPLSTSYAYDTTDFSSPAFTGSPSGATLTGGTN